MDETINDIKTTTETNNNNLVPPPPPPPPPPSSVTSTTIKNKEIINPITINIEKAIKNINFIPFKPVPYVPFNFTFKNENKKLKNSKAILSSKWVIIDNENNKDDGSEIVLDIDKQVQYSLDSDVPTISFTPQLEHSNKILKVLIKLDPLILKSTINDSSSSGNIFSKLFSSSSNKKKDHDVTKQQQQQQQQQEDNETLEPIIIEYKHKILFEKKREILNLINQEEIVQQDNSNKYRIISYNILADCYVSDSYYTNCPPYSLRWGSYRSKLLIPQIKQYDADIIGLQEVDSLYWQLFKEMNQSGYSYYPNYGSDTQEKPPTTMMGFNGKYREGSFIFFKKNRFSLIKGLEIDYTKIMRDNQLIDNNYVNDLINQDETYRKVITHYLEHSTHHVHHCLALLNDLKTNQKIIMVSKHLYWGGSAPSTNYQIQSIQIHLFTKILERFIDSNKLEKDIPIIVVGDFNSSPNGDCYTFLTKGIMENNNTKITDIKHDFNFASAYSFRPDGEPKFTIVSKSFTGNIDQIYISKDRFKVNSVLEIGERKDYKELPSLTLASDHILIMSDLYLLPFKK